MVRANNEHRQLRGSFSGIRGGEVWRTGARAGLGGIAGHDLGHVSSPWVVPRSELLALPGAARPCYAHSKRTFQGPSREPSRGQLLEVSQIFLGRLRASKSSTRLMWRFLWRTNLPKKSACMSNNNMEEYSPKKVRKIGKNRY